jgi:hypothetical protein
MILKKILKLRCYFISRWAFQDVNRIDACSISISQKFLSQNAFTLPNFKSLNSGLVIFYFTKENRDLFYSKKRANPWKFSNQRRSYESLNLKRFEWRTAISTTPSTTLHIIGTSYSVTYISATNQSAFGTFI